MDLYSPSRIASLNTPKQLQEAAADIGSEIATLEAIDNRSSLQEQGLRNLKASAALVMSKLESMGTGIAKGSDGRWRIMGGDRIENDPNDRPSDRKRAELLNRIQPDNTGVMQIGTINGKPVFAVDHNQRLESINRNREPADPNSLGAIISAHARNDLSGLSDRLKASLNENSVSGTEYTANREVSNQVVDLARAQNVASRAGMQMIDATGESWSIAQIKGDPTFAHKIKNYAFQESSMRIGAYTSTPIMIGSYIAMAREDVSNNLINLERLIQDTITKAFAVAIDNFALNGLPSPASWQGLLNVGVTSKTNSGKDEILSTDVATGDYAWGSLSAAALKVRQSNHSPVAAIMSPAREQTLLDSTDDQGRWLGAPPSLQNVSLLSTTQCGESKAIIGDFSKFACILRQGVTLTWSDIADEAFLRYQRLYLAYARLDFALLDDSAFHLVNITG